MNKFFTIIITIAFLSFFGYFSLYPAYNSWQGDIDKLEEVQNKLETRNQYFSELDKLNQKLNDYREGLGIVETALPDNISLPKLYNYLQERGSQKGLVVQEFSSKEVEENDNSTEEAKAQARTVDVKVSGSYSKFKEFVKELESSARLFSVESASIEAPTGPGGADEEQQEEEGLEGEQAFPFSIQLKIYSY